MPSTLPLPTVGALVRAATGAPSGASKQPGALQAERDPFGNGRSGSIYNHTTGPMAVLWSREAQRDQDAFRDLYLDDATGWPLTRLVQGRYGIARVRDAAGVGTLDIARPTAGGGAGTAWEGTRIQIAGLPPVFYEVAADTPLAAGAIVATLPIRATVTGTGTACQADSGLSFADPLYDLTWAPVALTCADGTDFESAPAYRSRARAELLAERNGYVAAVIAACQAAGAVYVVPFASSYGVEAGVYVDGDWTIDVTAVVAATGFRVANIHTRTPHGFAPGDRVTLVGISATAPGHTLALLNGTWPVSGVLSPTSFQVATTGDRTGIYALGGVVTTGGKADYGLNAVYVADANYQSSAALVDACAAALESVRVLGADLWVGGIVQTPLRIGAVVTSTDDVARVPQIAVKRAAAQAMLGYFGPTAGGYTFKRETMAGAIAKGSAFVQAATVSVSIGGVVQTTDPTLSPNAWPATLTRYTLAGSDISIALQSP